MKYSIYSYRDAKVGFGSPFVDQSDATAIRGFSYAMNDEHGIMSFCPSDFDLYLLGDFDTESGVITPCGVPLMIVSGSSVMR